MGDIKRPDDLVIDDCVSFESFSEAQRPETALTLPAVIHFGDCWSSLSIKDLREIAKFSTECADWAEQQGVKAPSYTEWALKHV